MSETDYTKIPEVQVRASVKVLSITRTVGGRVLAHLFLNGIDYVELNWDNLETSVIDKPKPPR